MPLFDTHCHIDLPVFDQDRVQVLQRARNAGVSDLLVPGVARSGWEGLVSLCAGDKGLHSALGLHPMFMAQHSLDDVDALEDMIVQHRPLAVGEIGLDYRVAADERQRQRILLAAQLDIAARHRLPVILHVVKAQDDMLSILQDHDHAGGICHAFSGSLQQAQRFVEQGFRLGFGGMLTFERSSRLRQLAAALPLEAMVLETDAPDLPGAAHRYERNSPEWLPDVMRTLLDIRSEPADLIAAQLWSNSRAALGIPATT